MKRKLLAVFLVVSIMTVLFAGCGNGSADANSSAPSSSIGNDPAGEPSANTNSSSDGSSVVIAIGQDAEPEAGFDPINGWSATGHTHDPLMQSTLLTVEDDISLGYDLATEYTVSDDGLVWTFKIRPDVKFTDGEPLTARDVAFTYNTARSTVTSLDLSMLENAEAVDDTTVVFNLNKPYSPFAYVIAVVGIVPEHAYNSATYGDNPIGSGPFILKQWNKGEQVIFEANPDYYGEPSTIQKLTVVFMTEEAAYAAAQSGQVDVAQTNASYTVAPISGYTLTAFESVDHRGLNLPVLPAGSTVTKIGGDEEVEAGNDVTSNLAVRQAMSYAIDRQTIADVVFYGYASPSYSNSPGMPWENEATRVEYNPEKAKSIMEADGWALNSQGIYEKDGLLAEITITCMDESGRQGILMAVKEMLDEFGIKINIQGGMSWDEIEPTTYTTPNIMGGGQFSPIADISRFYTGQNRCSYSNKTVDKHIDDGLAADTMEEAYEHFKLAAWDGTTGYITDADCPWVFLVSVKHIYYVRDGLNLTEGQIFPHGYGWAICNNVNKWHWN